MLHGCSPVDEAVRAERPETLVVRMDVPATEVYDVTAFRFEDGLLREVVEAEPLQGQDAYGVSLEKIPGRLYLQANSSALEAMTALFPETVREDEFLALTATVEEMTGRGLLMTGSLELRDNVAGTLPVSMRRSVARIDVAALEAGVEVLSVEINGKEDESLFIFVNPLETSKPSKDDPDVTYYEAGTVTEAGSLSVPSGHTLYIEGGAIVKGNLTCAQNSSDITIKGCGIFDSRGVNARAIQFHKISGLVIDGITMLNDINWTTFIAEGTDIAINNYKVVAVYNPENSSGCENDAIDLLGCRNARVTGCFGYAHDDIFCIKSWKWSYKGEVEDVVFDDCIAWNYRSGNSFVVGAETGCDISGVTYRNCISIHSAGNPSGTLNRGGLSVHHCAGGHVQDILFENITLEDCKEYGIHIDIRESYVSNLGNDEGNNQIPFSPGTADGITLRNINIMQAPPKGNFLFGYDAAHKITGLVFDNVCQEGTEITAGNITTFFDPAMSYQRNGHISYNLTNVEYDFE